MQIDTSVIKIDTNLIIPNKYQPRKVFEDSSLKSLADSIQKYGIINPILVRKKEDKYEIIAGERRYRAAKLIGLTEVPVIIKTADEQQMAELALIENLQRQDLSAIEEAKSYEEIMKIGNQTQASLAERVGKSQSFIANKIRLLSLPEEIQDALANKKISERHARSLLSVEEEEKQLEILDRIIEEKLTVKETEHLIHEKTITENEIKQAISDIMKSLNIVEDNEEDKKEEKEDDNMNNGNFFPSFDNNGGNNTSLNMMNMQSMNQMPMEPAEEVVMPTPMPATPNIPTPEFAPEPQLGSSLMPNTNEMNPFASFGTPPMNNNMNTQPIEPVSSPNPTPSVEAPQMNIPVPGFVSSPEQPTIPQEPTYAPAMDIPLFNPNATMPVPGFEPVQEPPMPVSTPLVEEPNQIPIIEPATLVEAPLPLPQTNKLENLKNILNANGYNYKVYSNETDNCVIIELPKN